MGWVELAELVVVMIPGPRPWPGYLIPSHDSAVSLSMQLVTMATATLREGPFLQCLQRFVLSGLACKMTPEERGGGRVEGGWVLEKLREERQTGRAR